MIFFANFLGALGFVLGMVLSTLIFLVIARAILSWVSPDPMNPIVRFIVSSTEPFIRPIRKRVPLVGGGIDLSPLIFLFLLYFLREFLVRTLLDYAQTLRY